MTLFKTFIIIVSCVIFVFGRAKETSLSLSYPMQFINYSLGNSQSYIEIIDCSIDHKIFAKNNEFFFISGIAYTFEGVKYGGLGNLYIAFPRAGIGYKSKAKSNHSFEHSLLVGSMFAYAHPEVEFTLATGMRSEFLFTIRKNVLFGPFCELLFAERFKEYSGIGADLNVFKIGVSFSLSH